MRKVAYILRAMVSHCCHNGSRKPAAGVSLGAVQAPDSGATRIGFGGGHCGLARGFYGAWRGDTWPRATYAGFNYFGLSGFPQKNSVSPRGSR